MEEITIKKNSIYLLTLIIIMSILFLISSYKNGLTFILIFVIALFLLIKSILKKQKERIEELKYSKNLLINDKLLREEVKNCTTNTKRGYLLTENFYIDCNRKNVIKFEEIDNIKLKFSFSFIPIIGNYGLSQYILVTTKDNKKIHILNWSLSHWYPENGEIYDIFDKKTNKNIK